VIPILSETGDVIEVSTESKKEFTAGDVLRSSYGQFGVCLGYDLDAKRPWIYSEKGHIIAIKKSDVFNWNHRIAHKCIDVWRASYCENDDLSDLGSWVLANLLLKVRSLLSKKQVAEPTVDTVMFK